MELIKPMLERLNAAVDRHNAKVDAAVELGKMDSEREKFWRLPPGCVTEDLVKAGPEKWSGVLRKAVMNVVVNASPDEVIRLADCCPIQTETIKQLRFGSKRSVGRKGGQFEGLPVGIREIELAHLIAHAGASKVVLLG